MSKFICAITKSGLQGFDNIFDTSELTGGTISGTDTLVDSSALVVV